jgi:hypothetical protein
MAVLGLTADGERDPGEERSWRTMELLVGDVPARLTPWGLLYGRSMLFSELGELIGLERSTKLP